LSSVVSSSCFEFQLVAATNTIGQVNTHLIFQVLPNFADFILEVVLDILHAQLKPSGAGLFIVKFAESCLELPIEQGTQFGHGAQQVRGNPQFNSPLA
jgi:hypothetical protein